MHKQADQCSKREKKFPSLTKLKTCAGQPVVSLITVDVNNTLAESLSSKLIVISRHLGTNEFFKKPLTERSGSHLLSPPERSTRLQAKVRSGKYNPELFLTPTAYSYD